MEGFQVKPNKISSVLFILLVIAVTASQSQLLPTGKDCNVTRRQHFRIQLRNLYFRATMLNFQNIKALVGVRVYYSTNDSCDGHISSLLLTQVQLNITDLGQATVLEYHRTLVTTLFQELQKASNKLQRQATSNAVVLSNIGEVKRQLREMATGIAKAIKLGRIYGAIPPAAGTNSAAGSYPVSPPAAHVACVLLDVVAAAQQMKSGFHGLREKV